MLDVMLLGTGAMVPLPGRALSSVLVRISSSLVLLDCGEGTQVQMRRAHWGFKALDAICLSHFHADHIAGIPGLLHTLANAGKRTPLHIYGPVGTLPLLESLLVIAPFLPFDVLVYELEAGDTFAMENGMRGQVEGGEHRVPVLTWRFDVDRAPAFRPDVAERLGVPRTSWSDLQRGQPVEVAGRTVRPGEVLSEPRPGIALGFVTDTRPTHDIIEQMRGVDLLISEGTFAREDQLEKALARGHMTFGEAARMARAANVGHLWLTHFSAGLPDPENWADNARDIFPRTTIGRAGLTGTIAFERGYCVASAGGFPEST